MGHFGRTYHNAVVRYSVETEPLGTGGAIVHALRQEGDDPVLVLNGDTFLNVDYRELIDWYERAPVQVVVVLKELSNAARYGSVLAIGERISGFVEKGKAETGLINAGVYIVHPAFLKPLAYRASLVLKPTCCNAAAVHYLREHF